MPAPNGRASKPSVSRNPSQNNATSSGRTRGAHDQFPSPHSTKTASFTVQLSRRTGIKVTGIAIHGLVLRWNVGFWSDGNMLG